MWILYLLLAVVCFIGTIFLGNKAWETGPFRDKQATKEEIAQAPEREESSSLRKLQPLETGKSIKELSDNIYGFVDAHEIYMSIEFPSEDRLILSNNPGRDSFELQKINNRIFLIGFISEGDYSKIGNANKNNPLDLILFPCKWNDFDKIISLPLDTIKELKRRRIDIEAGSTAILEVKSEEIISDAISHRDVE